MTEAIFIHIPKNAGRSILSALGRDFRKDHRTIADHCSTLGETTVKSRFKFTCIRNPWDRAVSWWSFFGNMGINPVPFDQWLKKIGNRPRLSPSHKFPLDQMSFCRASNGDVLMDAFLRFENLDADWPPIAKRLNVSETLPKIGKQNRQRLIRMRDALLRSKRPDLAPVIPSENYRDMYDSQDLIDLVGRLDSKTIQRFGYSFP